MRPPHLTAGHRLCICDAATHGPIRFNSNERLSVSSPPRRHCAPWARHHEDLLNRGTR